MRRYMKAYFFPGLKSRGYPQAWGAWGSVVVKALRC
jgi:hypothetical protein